MIEKPTPSILQHFSSIEAPRIDRQLISSLTEGEVIAIDGKCLRRSLDKASKKAAIYRVDAWAQQNSLVLGQLKLIRNHRYSKAVFTAGYIKGNLHDDVETYFTTSHPLYHLLLLRLAMM